MKDKMFYRYTKQSYARNKDGECVSILEGKTERIMVGIYPDGGDQGTTGEFEMSWQMLGGKNCPAVRVFDDAWHLFDEMKEFFQLLVRVKNITITPDEMEKELILMGYKPIVR